MRLAVALDLCHLDQRFVRRAPAGIGRRHRPATGADHLEHQPARDIAVVRDGEHLPARRLLIGVHIVPQLADRRVALSRIIGQDLIGLVLTVAEHDDAVHIVAARHQRVLEPDESGELAGLVIAFDDTAVRCPDLGRPFILSLAIAERGRQRVATSKIDQLGGHLQAPCRPFMHRVVPAQQGRVADEQARCIIERLCRAQPARVIGDNEEVERPVKLCLEATGRCHFRPAREPQRIFRP